jgi:hypothetical protein
MAGKYEAFRKVYPKAPIESDAFDRINTVLDGPLDNTVEVGNQLRLRDADNTQLCEFYINVRKEIDELEAHLSVLETQKAALTYLFTNRFEEDDVTSMKFANGVTLGESVEPLPNVKDRQQLINWIKETGQEELLTLNYQTLASITKQALLEGKSIPPGVEVFMKQKLTARGLKAKGESNND